MSYYDDERQRYRPARDKPRRDSYDDETVYASRNTRSSALVKRKDSYDSDVDEVTRTFPPPDGRGGYIRETTIRKSGVRPARTRSYEDDRYDDRYDDRSYAGGRRSSRRVDDKRDRQRRYSSDYSSRSRSRTPPRRDRRKSQPEQALEALGLGGLAATLLGKKDRSSSRDRDRNRSRGRARSEDRYSSRRRSKSRGMTGQEQLANALKAAVLAGAGEAFRARKEPGGWSGEKGKRVLTAAFSAGGVDGLISHNKDKDDHNTRNAIGSAIAGIATSRIVNGPRSKSRGRGVSPDGRNGRSQSRGGLGDLAAGGVMAAAAKKVYDNVRNRSQSRGRRDSRSRSPGDSSRSPSRTSRRRSVSRAAARGLAAVGLTGTAEKLDPDRQRSRRYSNENDNRSGGYYDDRDYVGQPRSGPVNERARSVSQSRADWHVAERASPVHPNYSLDYGPHKNGDPETDSDSDLGSSTDEENEHRKGKRKQLITAGLATVATVHAGHSVYQSYEKRRIRQEAVREGKISKEQAKQNRNRDRLQDAASVGLAALGIKGAYSEWKEMKEAREEHKEETQKILRHRSKRAARREKYESALKYGGYQDNNFSNSMPNLHTPQPLSVPPGTNYPFPNQQGPVYDGQGPYGAMSQANNIPHYYDDNPYAASQGYYPAQNHTMPGSQFPPPPLGHPPPQQNYPPAPASTASPRQPQGH